MGANVLARMGEIHQKLADNHLPAMLVYSTGCFTIALGIIFWWDAEKYTASPTFEYTFAYARPEMWGAVMGITGLLMMFGFWQNRTSGRAPAFVLTLIFATLGITAVGGGVYNPNALFSASAVYTFVAIICAICIFACSSAARSGGRRYAPPADHHLDH